MKYFNMSETEGTLTISLFIGESLFTLVKLVCSSSYLAGYCVGPFIWAPTSESYGRRPMFILGFLGYFLFQIACALAPNGPALLVFRFLSGCFAACPLTNSGAVLGDM